jgi:endopeptidase La
MSNLDLKLKIKTFKLNILQQRYKYLSNIILRLEKHLDYLCNNNNIDIMEKNHNLGAIFNISKKLNSSYNNYILKKLDKITTFDSKLLEIISSCNVDISYDMLYEYVLPIIKEHNDELSLCDEECEIKKIINNVGYDNIIDLLSIINNNFDLSVKQTDLLNELQHIFIVTKVNFFNVSNQSTDYYWRIPPTFLENDLLELNRELWLKNQKTNEYIKLDGYFINDSLSCFIKTSQINYPILQKNKNKIMNILYPNQTNNIDMLDDTDNKVDTKNTSSINNEFIKKFIRYDYLGNIYCLTHKNYIKHIEKNYQIYMESVSSTFINIMKDFISKGSEIKKMYETIFLLLLGNADNCDIAGLLLGITKEKKTNSPLIYNLLCQRLPYYLLVKIKKSNNSIKTELEKLKSLSPDDVDYKKQLVANKNISPNIKSIVLEKIEEMKSSNNEYYKQLTFVKHILNFPWSSSNDDLFFTDISNNSEKSKTYLNNIKDKLTNLSYGHDEGKKVIMQTIGKWISNPSSQGTCFGLVGPPGVGKTLLAKSLSKALDIPFAEITLGGQNDGEILYGHGYTYSGSQPGLIIKKMVEMGRSRCILYFDELDKACSKHGTVNEITSILIHLTDPNMNKTFQDRFFQGVDFPLDKVIMIFSYNDSKLVDPILLDRLKEIHIDAYTIVEKIKIVKEFIINEVATAIGLTEEPWININEKLIEYIIENYTSEAGVRSIKRKIEQIFLTLNLEKIYKNGEFTNGILKEITKEIVVRILEEPKNDNTNIHSKPTVGIINGLYATSNGDGGIIPIQIFSNFSSSSNFELKLTGKQGDVMKESVQCSLTAALDYIRRNSSKYNIDNIDEHLLKNFKHGFHIHCPETSTPKDGPSAGGAFTSCFISRLLNKEIKNDIAMTGEIDLTGRITKIGGLVHKLTGAKKAGVKLVFIPKDNTKDLEEIKTKNPTLVDSNFQVKIVEYVDDLIDDILV